MVRGIRSMLDERTTQLVGGLLYPIIFEKRPEDGIERVIQLMVAQNPLGATVADFRRAIEEALASNAKLSKIIPLDHDEQTIRSYLRALSEKLVETAA